MLNPEQILHQSRPYPQIPKGNLTLSKFNKPGAETKDHDQCPVYLCFVEAWHGGTKSSTLYAQV